MSFPSDPNVTQSLLRLSREISQFGDFPPNLRDFGRKSQILALLFEEIAGENVPRSAALCLKELLVVLRRFKSLLADCSVRSRTRLLLQYDTIAVQFHDLNLDLSSLLGMLPISDLGVGDDVADLVDLVRRQCRRPGSTADQVKDRLRSRILDMIRDIELGTAPDRVELEGVFEQLGLQGSRSFSEEIERLEREIGDRVAERWTAAMVAVVGLLRYGRCVVFGGSTPRSDPGNIGFPESAEMAVPPDFRCPISLELMTDPVVVATGQTYDRDSITRWIEAGHATCPKSGQALAHTKLIRNRALRNLIARFCREHDLPFEANEEDGGGVEVTAHFAAAAAAGNKAAIEAARMTALFLVRKLEASPEGASRAVHELRQLAKAGEENRTVIAEAGAIPLLLPLLSSDDAGLQLDAVTALLNLSLLAANKQRIMRADGGLAGLLAVISNGLTWPARENAAAVIISLSSVHSYRRRLGRDRRVIRALVEVVNTAPAASKKDALSAILSLASDRENMANLLNEGVVEAAMDTVGVADVVDEAAAVLAAVAKRGGLEALLSLEGSVARLVGVLRRGAEWGRESAVAALVLMCRTSGGTAVAELAALPGIEFVVWELMNNGTERARRKATTLGRICRRWVAAKLAADENVGVPATAQ